MTRREALAAARAEFQRYQADLEAKKKPAKKQAQRGGRRPMLTTAQADELRRQYWIGRANTPPKIAERFGLGRTAVLNYANRKQKRVGV